VIETITILSTEKKEEKGTTNIRYCTICKYDAALINNYRTPSIAKILKFRFSATYNVKFLRNKLSTFFEPPRIYYTIVIKGVNYN